MVKDARRPALALAALAWACLACAGRAWAEAWPEEQSRGEAQAATAWFSSDEGAFQGDPLPALAAKGYCLSVRAEGGAETRILFRDGLEVERRVVRKTGSGSLERVLKGGVLREERRSGQRGELLEELFYFESGLLRERRAYGYEARRLAKVEAFDSGGAPLGALSYRYDPRGRLAELAATGSFGEARSGLLGLPGGGIAAEWSTLEGELLLRRFDQAGRVASVETRRGDAVLRRESFSYEGSSARPSFSLLEDLASGEGTEKAFDAAGRILSLRVLSKGAERSRTDFAYDAKGRLESERTRSGGSLTLRSLSYDEEGGLLREETRKDGLLFRTVVFAGEGRVEEYFEGGILVLRATYEGARKVKDEFFEGGQVARSRSYP
jgi:hypothetical protein